MRRPPIPPASVEDSAIIKNIPPYAWSDFDGRPQFELVKFSGRGLRGHDFDGFVKRASHPLAEWARSYKPLPGEFVAHLIALGSTEKVGCFFAGAPVQTPDGLRPIEEIRAGDLVLTHKNRYRRVAETFSGPYSGSRITLRASGMPERLVSTDEHPYWAVRRSDFGAPARCQAYLQRKGSSKRQAVDEVIAAKSSFVRADQLKVGDYLVVPTAAPEPDSEIFDDKDAYLMGVYVAEGCTSKEYRPEVSTYGKPKTIVLTVSEAKRPLLEKIRQVTGRHIGEQRSYTSDVGLRGQIGDVRLARDCVRLFGNIGVTKRIHPAIFSQSLEWKLEFLAGYLDGDGCVDSGKTRRTMGTLKPNTASLNLALDLQRLCANVGIPAAIAKGWNQKKNGCFGKKDNVIYSLNIGSAYAPDLVARCVRLKMPDDMPVRTVKSAAGQVGSEYMLVPITSVMIDEVEDETKYNFEVEEDNSYVVYTAVHNCNRNSDYYGEHMLERDHPSFEKHARLYLDHKNKRQDQSYGVVKKSHFDKQLGRVELIAALNATKEAAERNGGLVAASTLEKLANNIDVPVSQSCFVPGDFCNSCNHFARNRSEYCGPQTCKYGGCRDNLGRVFEDGFQLGVDNRNCKFFDISDVSRTRGADRTAFITGKVAAADHTIGGAELAEMLGLVAPEHLLDPHTIAAASALRKLASAPKPGHSPASSWDECLTVRAKRVRGFAKAAEFPNDDHGRHTMLAELSRDGVILPPARWLQAVTGGPLDKCASIFATGVDPRLLLDHEDFHEKLASADYADSRLSPPNAYAWMAPTRSSHAEESAVATITGPAKFASQQAPDNVIEAAKLHYLAYQANVLGKHANSPNLPTMLVECARHNTGSTI